MNLYYCLIRWRNLGLLSNEEQNGGCIVSEHYLKLPSFQRTYWKHRATIRWVKLGDESTKFFQIKATIKYRKNHINSLKYEVGQEVSDHQVKVVVLWRAFKQRLSTSIPTFESFSLNNLLPRHDNLAELKRPFTKEEIDVLISKSVTN